MKEKLLEIARTVIEMNTDIEAALTGSLLLLHDSYRIRREATDIDIICIALCETHFRSPNVPDGFKLLERDGSGSNVESVVYKNEEGIKIDFMFSEERRETLMKSFVASRILFGQNLVLQKATKTESRMKHLQDVIYLIDNNDILLIGNIYLVQRNIGSLHRWGFLCALCTLRTSSGVVHCMQSRLLNRGLLFFHGFAYSGNH